MSVRKLHGVLELGLKLLELSVMLILDDVTLELLQNLANVEVATVLLLILEVGASEPITAQVAIYFDLRALIFDVLLDTFQSLHLLKTAETLYLEAIALVLYVLLEVHEIHALMKLLVIASV